jgi:hypothetical protein
MYVVVSRETDSKFTLQLHFCNWQCRLSQHAKWEVSNIFIKDDMENWLFKNKIPFSGDLLKTELDAPRKIVRL